MEKKEISLYEYIGYYLGYVCNRVILGLLQQSYMYVCFMKVIK